MSLSKKIYFSPLGYCISAALNFWGLFSGPFMIYGYRNRVTKKFLRGVRISSSSIITEKSRLDIGDNVWINHYARVDASGGVTIGEGCQIGYSSMILSHSSHNAIRLNGRNYIHMDIEDRKGYIHKSVKIGAYTFVGGGSCIMPGVTVGKGCVIGVGSVVTKDVPDYAIVAGVPAKIIGSTLDTDKKYFSDETVLKNYYNPDYLKSAMKI